MPANDLETLTVALEARISQFTKAMDKALKDANGAASGVEKRFSKMQKNLDSTFGRIGKTIGGGLSGGLGALGIGGILGGAGLAGVISTLRGVASELAAIQDVADRTGASTGFLQEIRYAGEQAGATVEDVDTSFQRFVKNIGDRGSEISKIFKKNKIAIEDVEEAFRDTADMIQRAKNPQEAFNIAVSAFGKGAGPAMVGALKDGREGLARAAEEARRFGAVAEADIIKKAAQIDDEFTKLARAIKVQFGGAVLGAIGDLETLQNAMIGVALVAGGALTGRAIGPLVSQLTLAAAGAAGAARSMTVLQAASAAATLAGQGLVAVLRLLATGTVIGAGIGLVAGAIYLLSQRNDEAVESADKHKEALKALDTIIGQVKDSVPGAVAALKTLGDQHIENAEKALTAAEAELKARQAVLSQIDQAPVDVRMSSEGASAASTQTIEIEKQLAMVQQLRKQLDEVNNRVSRAIVNAPGGGGGTTTDTDTSSSSTKLNEYERQTKAIDDRIAALKIEQKAVGLTAQQQAELTTRLELENAAKEAGIALSPEVVKDINARAKAMGDLAGSMEKAKAATEAINEAQKAFASEAAGAFESLIVDGESLNEVLSNVLDNLARMLIQASIAGTGPLAGILGTAAPTSGVGAGGAGGLAGIFAGFFAKGGTIRSGQVGVVGERGPELVRGGMGGTKVIPPEKLRTGSARRGPSVNIDARIYAPGADTAALARVAAGQEALKRDIPRQIQAGIQNARNRRMR